MSEVQTERKTYSKTLASLSHGTENTAWSEAVDDHLRNSYTNRKSDHLLVRRVVKSNKVKNRSVPKNRLFLKEKIKLKFSHQCTSQVFCIKIKTVQQYLPFMFEHRQPKSTRRSCQEHPRHERRQQQRISALAKSLIPHGGSPGVFCI